MVGDHNTATRERFERQVKAKPPRSIKIDEETYQILRRWAFERETTIQAVIADTVASVKAKK